MNYQKIYDQIIDRARNRELNCYKEKHHIIPKCMGGNNNKNNLINLTAREHFISHQLLCKIYPENAKLAFALWRMCNKGSKNQERNYKISSRTYEIIRDNHAKFLSKALTGIPKPNGFGKKISKKLKGRVSYWKGKVQSPYHIEKRAISLRGKTGRTRTKETEYKIQRTRIKKGSATKPIIQYYKDNTILSEWKSLTQAANTLGINIGSISSCIKGKQKTAGGYIWKYKKN